MAAENVYDVWPLGDLIFEKLFFCKSRESGCGKSANANKNGELRVPPSPWDSVGQWDTRPATKRTALAVLSG